MGNSPEVPRWLHGAVPSQRQSQVRVFHSVEGNPLLFPGPGSWRLCKPRTFSLERASLSKRLLGFGISRILIRMVSVTSFHPHLLKSQIRRYLEPYYCRQVKHRGVLCCNAPLRAVPKGRTSPTSAASQVCLSKYNQLSSR